MVLAKHRLTKRQVVTPLADIVVIFIDASHLAHFGFKPRMRLTREGTNRVPKIVIGASEARLRTQIRRTYHGTDDN